MPTYTGTFSNRSQYQLQLILTEGTQSIANNTTQVSFTLRIVESPEWGSWTANSATYSINIDGQTFSGSFTYDFRNYNTLNLRTGTVTIDHNNDGTKTVSASASVGGSTTIGNASASGSFALTTIPRASNSTFSVSAVDAGTAFTITTNRASTSFTHTLRYSFGSLTNQTIATGVGASTSWTPPLSLLQQIPNATSGTMTITTITFSGSTQIGSTSRTITLRAGPGVVPSISSISDSEFVSAVASAVGAYVRGQSQITLSMNGEAGIQGSTISSRTITFAGNTINAGSGTTAVITQSGTLTATASVTDSRGRTASITKNISVLDWVAPAFAVGSPTVIRSTAGGVPDNQGTSLRVSLNASVSSLINSTQRNSIRYRVQTRVRNTGSYVTRADVTPAGISFNGTFVISGTYAVDSAYDVRVEVIDIFATSTVQSVIATAAVFMHWGDGLAIGKFYEPGRGSIDAMGQIYQNNGQFVPSIGNMGWVPVLNKAPGFMLDRFVDFLSSGTLTLASIADARALGVWVTGGGGGGGGSSSAPTGEVHVASGGGGGFTRYRLFRDLSIFTGNISVTVGAGGAGATTTAGTGSTGGTSNIVHAGVTVLSAIGGSGGNGIGFTTPGSEEGGSGGGVGTGSADMEFPGEDGGASGCFAVANAIRVAISGQGGHSYWGSGGRAVRAGGTSGGSGQNGRNGVGRGSGGSGSVARPGQSAATGGSGAAGRVLFEVYL
jgi:hypothetical protein